MDTAERLLVETGDKDLVSIRAIAKDVGCTPPAIYLHFADKEELFFRVCEIRFNELAAALRDARGDESDPKESVRRLGRAYVRFARENPEHYRAIMMSRLEGLPDGVEIEGLEGMRGFYYLVEAVQQGIEAGDFRPADPVMAAVGMWTSLHGIVSLTMTLANFPFPEFDALVEHAIEVQIAGLSRT